MAGHPANTMLTGWEKYPQNLPIVGSERFAYDLDNCNERLKKDSSRIFSPPEDTYLQATHTGEPPRLIEGSESLESYLNETKTFRGCRIIFIPQLGAINPLLISEGCLRKLLTHLKAFPPMLNAVHAFGIQNGEDVRSGNTFSSRSDKAARVEETCWLLQHVELHGRDEHSNPWSLRQMGVYQKTDGVNEQETTIVINPSSRFQQRAKEITDPSNASESVRILLLSTSTSNWRQHIDWLETRLEQLTKKINQKVNYDVQFNDMLEVQNLRHKLCIAKTAMNRNLLVIKFLQDRARTLPLPQQSTPLGIGHVAAECRLELESLLLRASDMSLRIDGASSLVASILDFHATQAAQSSNNKAGKMAKLAQKNNNLMINMTKRSLADARTLKTITILTLIYLPASFVATFLNMNYVTVKTHPVSVSCKAEMYIFGILTLMLLVVTLGGWRLYEMRRRRDQDRDMSVSELKSLV